MRSTCNRTFRSKGPRAGEAAGPPSTGNCAQTACSTPISRGPWRSTTTRSARPFGSWGDMIATTWDSSSSFNGRARGIIEGRTNMKPSYDTGIAGLAQPDGGLRRHNGIPGIARALHRTRDRKLRDARRFSGHGDLGRAGEASGASYLLRRDHRHALGELPIAPAALAHPEDYAVAQSSAAGSCSGPCDPIRTVLERGQRRGASHRPYPSVGHGDSKRGPTDSSRRIATHHDHDRNDHADHDRSCGFHAGYAGREEGRCTDKASENGGGRYGICFRMRRRRHPLCARRRLLLSGTAAAGRRYANVADGSLRG